VPSAGRCLCGGVELDVLTHSLCALQLRHWWRVWDRQQLLVIIVRQVWSGLLCWGPVFLYADVYGMCFVHRARICLVMECK
jgi:hypothetical protein